MASSEDAIMKFAVTGDWTYFCTALLSGKAWPEQVPLVLFYENMCSLDMPKDVKIDLLSMFKAWLAEGGVFDDKAFLERCRLLAQHHPQQTLAPVVENVVFLIGLKTTHLNGMRGTVVKRGRCTHGRVAVSLRLHLRNVC